MNTIRKISVGVNFPDGALHYEVGKTHNLSGEIYKVKSIIKEVEANSAIYKILISNEFGSNIVWKEICGVPVVVEYLVNIE